MAVPVASAIQVAQQKAQEQAAPKQAESKFDSKLEQNQQGMQAKATQAVQQTQAAGQVQGAKAVEYARAVESLKKAEKTQLQNSKTASANNPATAKAAKPVELKEQTQKATNKLSQTLEHLTNNESQMQKLLKRATTEKHMNPQDFLAIQVQVQQISLELDLTGKVVEQATSGLKESLRTQV